MIRTLLRLLPWWLRRESVEARPAEFAEHPMFASMDERTRRP